MRIEGGWKTGRQLCKGRQHSVPAHLFPPKRRQWERLTTAQPSLRGSLCNHHVPRMVRASQVEGKASRERERGDFQKPNRLGRRRRCAATTTPSGAPRQSTPQLPRLPNPLRPSIRPISARPITDFPTNGARLLFNYDLASFSFASSPLE